MCDCVVKDSINFLDHINGRKRTYSLFLLYKHSVTCMHTADQRNMGMSMKVERCTVDQIKQRFDFNKKKKEEEKKKYGTYLTHLVYCL